MELMNTTIGAISHAWTSLSTSLLDRYSFSGFSNDEIFGSSMWQIKQNSLSTTVYVNPVYFVEVTSELTTLYGTPTSKGKNGQIFKCNMTHDDGVPAIVTITSYSTTAVLHVQGCLHKVWVDTLLDTIEQKVKHKRQINEPQPLDQPSEHELTVSFDTAQPSCTPPPLASTPIQKAMPCPPTCESKRLKDTITSLKDRIKDYKEQLSQFQELRSNYAHLSTSYRELSDRNCALQVELSSLKELQSEAAYQTPRTASPPSPAPTPAPIGASNPFSALTDEVPDDALPTASSAPNNSQHTPDKHVPQSPPTPKAARKPKAETKQPPNKQSLDPSTEETQPQILIFSNSMCSRINERKFYRGKTTRVFAKSGASIGDVQKLVEECEYDGPEYVVLKAWTNTATRETAENCERKARALINAALNKFPTAHIIISSALPRLIPVNRRNTNEIISQLNKMFEINCRNSTRVRFVDHISTFVMESGQIRTDLFYDKVHLNNHGLARLVINLRQAIDSVSSFHMNSHQPRR